MPASREPAAGRRSDRFRVSAARAVGRGHWQARICPCGIASRELAKFAVDRSFLQDVFAVTIELDTGATAIGQSALDVGTPVGWGELAGDVGTATSSDGTDAGLRTESGSNIPATRQTIIFGEQEVELERAMIAFVIGGLLTPAILFAPLVAGAIGSAFGIMALVYKLLGGRWKE